MSYQVIARKWRPKKFDDVIGQQAVTRTLGNALKSRRLAQAFVFAGPRGVGKTTTARILARALSCVNGPMPICAGTVRRASRSMKGATWTCSKSTRCDAYAGGQHPRRDHFWLVDRAGEKPLQDLHHRRGPSAVEPLVQRAAQIDSAAAAACHLHDGDDGARQDSRDRSVALSGV